MNDGTALVAPSSDPIGSFYPAGEGGVMKRGVGLDSEESEGRCEEKGTHPKPQKVKPKPRTEHRAARPTTRSLLL